MPTEPKIGAAAIPPLLDDDDPAPFPKLTDTQLAVLSPYGQARDIEVGDILFRPGEIPSEIMVLLAGEVTVTFGEGDHTRIIALQRPRDLLAEAVFDYGPSTPIAMDLAVLLANRWRKYMRHLISLLVGGRSPPARSTAFFASRSSASSASICSIDTPCCSTSSDCFGFPEARSRTSEIAIRRTVSLLPDRMISTARSIASTE
jgi:CRP-like cAMP-binding protein